MAESLPELPSESIDALAKAALLDEPFTLQTLVASGTLPESLDLLFDLKLLEDCEDGQAQFNSDAIRQAALSTLAWSHKRKLCYALAKTCQTLSAEPQLIARLFLQAQDHLSARENYLAAAEAACKAHAYRQALDAMKAAFEIWPIQEQTELRQRTLAEMTRCAKNCGDLESAHLSLVERLEMAEDAQEIEQCIELNRQLAQSANAVGDRLQARERLLAAAQLAEKHDRPQQSVRIWRSLAQAQGDSLRLREALSSLERAKAAALNCNEWAILSDSLAYQAMLTAMLGRIGEAQKMLEHALQIAIEHDLPDQITNAYRRQANVNEYASNYEAYRDKELEALDRCRSLSQDSSAQACLICVSYAFFRLGQFDESLAALDGESLSSSDLDGELAAAARSVRTCINAFRTTTPDTLAQLEAANRSNRIHGARVFEFYTYWAAGAHATLTRQFDQARSLFGELIDFWRQTDDRKDVVPGLLCAASFFADQNDPTQLSQCVDILNTIHSESESQEPQAALAAAQAENAWLHGKPKHAIESFQRALATYQELKLPLEQAWLLWRLGFVQRQAGLTSESAASWKAAESIAQSLSLKPLQRAIIRSRNEASPASGSPTALTPRQLQAARLLAKGLTNKEIADQLDLSPRTVEMHVAALIERLGCRTRAEAVKSATDLGLLD